MVKETGGARPLSHLIARPRCADCPTATASSTCRFTALCVAAHDDRGRAADHSGIATRRHIFRFKNAVVRALAHRNYTCLAAPGLVTINGYCGPPVGPSDDSCRRARFRISPRRGRGRRAGAAQQRDVQNQHPLTQQSLNHSGPSYFHSRPQTSIQC